MPKSEDTQRFEVIREQLHRQMLSSVSHDLKTPLATMIGSLEIFTRMHDKLSPEKRTALINSALGEAYRLDHFITNILDMAKLEGGMVTAKYEKTDIKPLIADCITRLGPRANQHTIQITGQDALSSVITTDPMLLSRAIGLVLDNATKHAGKQATILLEYGRDAESFYVRVHDNGPGIPPGAEEEIFSKYARLSRNDQQNAGTGLGLAICRKMMSIIGGSVAAENPAEGGAAFRLRLGLNG